MLKNKALNKIFKCLNDKNVRKQKIAGNFTTFNEKWLLK